MSALWFSHPEWLWACAAIVAVTGAALAGALALAARRTRILLGRSEGTRRRVTHDALLLAALGFAAIALLGPRIGQRDVEVTGSGVDLVILVDVSRSMNARDVPPDRLSRARRAAVGVLERLEPESRVALAAYSGRGVLLTPLTPDVAALAELVPALDSELIQPGGSALGDGVEVALGAFEAESDRPRVLLVLSDGEVTRRPDAVGDVTVRRNAIRVLAAAFGSPLGATIPDRGAPLRDAAGEIVVSRRQTRALERLTRAGGGRLFPADEWGELDLDELVREIQRDGRLAPGDFTVRRMTVPVVLPFAACAFVLLLLEALSFVAGGLLARARRLVPAQKWVGVLLSLVLLGPMILDPMSLGATDDAAQEVSAWESLALERALAPAELVHLGLARARAGDLGEADQAFRAAALTAPGPDLAALAYYNLGVTALERGELEAARDLFFDALALAAGDSRARFNLEWTLAALASPKPPPAQASEPKPKLQEEEDEGASQDREEDPAPAEPPDAQKRQEPEEEEAAVDGAGSGLTPAPPPPPLDAGELERWLERIEDAPGRALRTA
ncbi:MAG: VWA domain-containing protein, partial [Proteobacteria bacterium]|nr:VWA domain-containing protein [Pseudomonadota bacterium]